MPPSSPRNRTVAYRRADVWGSLWPALMGQDELPAAALDRAVQALTEQEWDSFGLKLVKCAVRFDPPVNRSLLDIAGA